MQEKRIEELIGELNFLMKQLIGKVDTFMGNMEKRMEVHYNDIYHISEKQKALEDYLGIEFIEKGVGIKRHYKKRK